ncbi:MAG: ferrous iron transport protein B [Candidatus Latescibacterota bacterium]|jgi:ferrous iron transport protein B
MSLPEPAASLPATRRHPLRIVLTGNPNTGKTTLFNALTGLSQRVGNFPGVTVERKAGRLTLAGVGQVELLDLPGTYSLAARSPDEAIAVDVLLGHQADLPKADAVLAIVDATNLRRNLYLVSQLLETGLPLVVALSMIDLAVDQGIEVDAAGLSRHLGVPVIPICASRREGLEPLRQALAEVLSNGRSPLRPLGPRYPEPLTEGMQALAAVGIHPDADGHLTELSTMEALRLLVDEGGHLEQRLAGGHRTDLASRVADERARLHHRLGGPAPSEVETTARYAWVDEALAGRVRTPGRLRPSSSDRIDRVLTDRVYGSAIFLVVAAVVFQGLYSWSVPLMAAIEYLLGGLGQAAVALLPEGPLLSLVTDGVIAGVGAVLVFLPQIAILFLFISILEDCGYMARAALLADRLLSLCGLSGKSFIPLLSSFACGVPGIMAARTIDDRKDRLVTILVAPLMSCSARLPVYVLFIAAFVPARPVLGPWLSLQGLTLLAMYSLGLVLAVPIAWGLRRFLRRQGATPFVMELPAYRWPGPRTVLLRVYQNTRAFVVRAGSIILAATVVMWALAYFPRPARIVDRYEQTRQEILADCAEPGCADRLEVLAREESSELLHHSALGRAGRWIEPLVTPLGWDWRIGVAALASFPAREVVISALGTLCNLGTDPGAPGTDLTTGLRQARRNDGTPLFNLPVALSVMVFFALCAQCLSTLITLQRETGSWGWTVFAFGYMTALAYGGAMVAYHGARALGWGA